MREAFPSGSFILSMKNIPKSLHRELMTKQSKWTKEWPSKPGWYWFYGHRYGDEVPSYAMIRVRKISNGVMLAIDGQFMFEADGHDGHFMTVKLPKPPEVDQNAS